MASVFMYALMLLYPLSARYMKYYDFYVRPGCEGNNILPGSGEADDCNVGDCEDIFATKNSIKVTSCTKLPTRQPTTPAPTKKSNSGADPRFHMWNGVWFAFHGECDIVLLQCSNFADGAGLFIHARTEIRTQYSFIRNLAFRIGDEVFEVAGQHEYYLNGVARVNAPSIYAGFSVKRMNETMRCGELGLCAKVIAYSLDLAEFGKVVVTIWRDFIYIAISGTNIGFNGSVGLLGNWGKPGKFARDNRTVLDDDNAFGEEWQVLKSEPMIFHEKRAPQHPQRCNPAPKVMERRFEDPQAETDARKACSRLSGEEFEMCIVDVMLTGDINMAFVPNFY